MRYGDEKDDDMPRINAKLTCRAEAEAAWLHGSILAGCARTSAVSSRAEREQRIREAAYFMAEQRGFDPGHEIDDWLAAEAALHSPGN
jgi:hypothetical protein